MIVDDRRAFATEDMRDSAIVLTCEVLQGFPLRDVVLVLRKSRVTDQAGELLEVPKAFLDRAFAKLA